MNIFRELAHSFTIDYKNLGEQDREYVYTEFNRECLSRVHWVSGLACIGELVLMLLDFVSGFFAEHPYNRLNMVAELLIIVASGILFARCEYVLKKDSDNTKAMIRICTIYKLILFVAILLFSFTDIYVRHKPLGAYIVFLFIFQILPFFRTVDNVCLFGAIIASVAVSYLAFVPGATPNSLFSIMFILVAFLLSTECLRVFFCKKIINSCRNHLMTKKFESLADQTILALANTVEAKDLYTKGHSQRVANYSMEMARRLGLDEARQKEVYYIGLLHDIGKIGVLDTVINKNGKLSDEEYADMKKHPEIGYDILKNITEIGDISLGARWHHERWDGKGYPDGLAGEDIPRIARVIAVADAYDAMTSTRSYRGIMPQSVVRAEIEKNAGKQFAPKAAEIMLQMIDEDTEYTMHE